MKQQLKSALDHTKEYWTGLPKGRKRLFVGIGGGVLLLAITLTVLLNISRSGFKVLYSGITPDETREVYATLQGMEISAQINSEGEIMVPKEQWDETMFELAGKGYPKTAPAYNIFFDNAGFTTTEFEKKQTLLFQLQDRMQETLERLTLVKGAVVTFDIPEDSVYVWEKNNAAVGSASVMLELEPGVELTPEQISAVKYLVASGVPKLEAKNVTVVDALTNVELRDGEDSSVYSQKRLELEREYAREIEDSVKRLLAGRYGPNGVTAVAKVVFDYDKMITEQNEVLPQDDGKGVITHFDEQYALGGQVAADGIVGEDQNTDTPTQYANQQGEDGAGGLTNYNRSIDYDMGYIKTQIERGEPLLKESSVAVIVNESDFTQERKDTLVALISKSVNIPASSIAVENLDFTLSGDDEQQQPDTPVGGFDITDNRTLLIVILAGALVLLLLIVGLILMLRGRKTKRSKVVEEMAQEGLTNERLMMNMQEEIEAHKRQIAASATAASNTKENAITEEIRHFARDNPEITANLIRGWLKEDE